MAGYVGTKAVLLSTTAATVGGDADIGGALDVGGAFTSQGIDDNANATAITIDSSENVGIGGIAASNSKLHVFDSTASVDDYTIHIESYTPALIFQDISGGPAIDFGIQVDGSAMMFRYGDASSGSQLASEAMRIDSSGNLLVGTTSVLSGSVDGANICVNPINEGSIRVSRNSGSNSNQITFWNTNGKVGSITTVSTSTAYNTSSDHRLKENVVELTGATDRLKQLNPSRFNFIADADTTVDGFLAHEVQAIVPEAITGEKDAVDADGNPEYQGIDQSKLVPLLTAALQEALDEITDLKARVAALEAN